MDFDLGLQSGNVPTTGPLQYFLLSLPKAHELIFPLCLLDPFFTFSILSVAQETDL